VEKGLGRAVRELLHADYGKIGQQWGVIQAVSENGCERQLHKGDMPDPRIGVHRLSPYNAVYWKD
jgi:hypothetical protein